MEEIKKRRTPVRRRITQLIQDSEAQMQAENPSEELLLSFQESLLVVKEKITSLDNEVLDYMLGAAFEEDEINAETDGAAVYEDKLTLCLVRIKTLVKKSNSNSDVASTTSFGTAQEGRREHNKTYKLPKIEVKKFTGELKDWLSWWSYFAQIHEDDSLHDSVKFQYLRQSMKEGTEASEIINGFPLTKVNYPLAVEALKQQYGREDLLIQVYVRELLGLIIKNVSGKEKLPLAKLIIQLKTHLRSLESLNISKADPATFLFPMVESSLPEEVLRAWQRSASSQVENGDEPKSRLSLLLEFCEKEVRNEQQISLAKDGFGVPGTMKKVSVDKRKSGGFESPVTAAALLTSEQSHCCIFCDKNGHNSPDCYRARKMTFEEKTQKIKENNACFKCLKKGHNAKKCKVKVQCFSCDKSHYQVMCHYKENKELAAITDGVKTMATSHPSSVLKSSAKQESFILRGTMRIKIAGARQLWKEARVLIDSGSDISYISEDLAESLELVPIGKRIFTTEVFGGGYDVCERKQYLVKLEGLPRGSEPVHERREVLELFSESNICGDCAPIPMGPWIKELLKLNVNLTDTYVDSTSIDILIGSNHIGKLVTGKMVKLNPKVIATETKLGWYLNGELPTTKSQTLSAKVISMSTRTTDLTALWELDVLGITDTIEKASREEQEAQLMEDFQKKLTRDGEGRYVVKLPWIHNSIEIPNNRNVALKRLESTTKKIMEKGEFDNYSNIFEAWKQEGIIETREEVGIADGHYLPHRPIFKPNSLTTPVRPVFDASCAMKNSPSLNQCLEKGPNLLEIIPKILIRFREKKVGVISDIRKAFQMIGVESEDRKYQRFLWWKNFESREVQEYQHCRVVFGLNCSPFILGAVLDFHLTHLPEEDKKTGTDLLRSLYVDNCVKSFHSVDEYANFKEDSTRILHQAKMDLREWESNADEVMEKEVTSVLGYNWDKQTDELYCDVPKVWNLDQELVVTKRTVLSIASQVFDPVGFTSPTILLLKIMLQEAWAQELKWDEVWGAEEVSKVLKWCKEAKDLVAVRIPRCAIGRTDDVQLHIFTDASCKAYSGVVFVRSTSEVGVHVQMLMAKSRVTPIKKPSPKNNSKKITIPRLELMGCVIGVRLANLVKDALGYEDIKMYRWTDSTTALQWIRLEENWTVFVGNRVKEINKYSAKTEWRHCPGKLNPADLPSRGCSPSELLQSRWWEGPDWLKLSEDKWPHSEEIVTEELVKAELKKTVSTLSAKIGSPIFYKTKFASYEKNLRVLAYMLRFAKRSQQRYPQFVQLEELKRAEIILIRVLQQQYFPDDKKIQPRVIRMEDRLLHVRTKLEFTEESEAFRYPILLPSKSPLVQELIREIHRANGHGGVQFTLGKLRERFWIPQGRKTVSQAIKECGACRRYDAKPFQVNPVALPEKRVTTGEVFTTTGVDLAGPLYLKDGRKCWIVLYTCAVYRCLILDIVESLSTEAFMNSLERFIHSHGRPNTLYSDNGTNFVGAKNLFKKLDWTEIHKKSNVKMIQWIMNPPTASWWGGWWERLVRSVKDLLKRMLGKAKLTRDELATCLSVVTSTINDRPLTTLNEDGEDLIPLTPSMFLKGTKMTRFPEVEMITGSELQSRYKQVKKMQVQLQARFRKEYLAELVQKANEKKTPDPKVGDIVLVGADNKKRWEWPLGRIVELSKGKDGESRSANVKTSKGVLRRPIQRLYPLEIPSCPLEIDIPTSCHDDDREEEEVGIDEVHQNAAPEVITRFGREVKRPQRYGTWNQ